MENNNRPLLPEATALWLIENTTLTFKQIANFCSMHELDVAAISNGDFVTKNIRPVSPIVTGQTLAEEILKCEQDPTRELKYYNILEEQEKRSRKGKLKGLVKSVNKENKKLRLEAALWLIKHSKMLDEKISNLLNITINSVRAIRSKSHKDYKHLTPKDPVAHHLITEEDVLS